MNQLIRAIRADVLAAKQRAANMDEFLSNVIHLTEQNPFLTPLYETQVAELVQAINNTMGLGPGGHRDIFRQTAYDQTMQKVVNMGEAMKADLSKIVGDSLNQGLGHREIAEQITNKVQGIGNSRAKAIARTETMDARVKGQWYTYNEKGYGFFVVPKNNKPGDNDKCKPYLDKLFTIDQTDKLPPYHPNCTHSPNWYRTEEDAAIDGYS